MQLNSALLLCIMHQRRINGTILKLLLARKRGFSRRMKLAKKRRITQKRRLWYKPGRTDLWWQNLISGVAPKEFWKKNFRLTDTMFFELVENLYPYILPNPNSPNTRAISAEKKVAIALYFLKDSGSVNMTANSFGIAINTASSIIFEVCYAITKYLGPKFLHLPKTEDEMRKKISEFEAKFGMTQAFGCIDGTHIPISCPSKHSQDYFNYKHFYSLNVQAVCDFKGTFMNVECMWPGSVHDAKVFANSFINKALCNKKIPIIYQTISQNHIMVPNYLISDPAYPLIPYCMKEYTCCRNNEEVIFNAMLRSARNPIECAFGRLKARWQILTKPITLKIEHVPFIIYACFVLHNLCEHHKVNIDDEILSSQIECIKANEVNHCQRPDPIFSCNDGEGEVIRRTLTQYISENIVQSE